MFSNVEQEWFLKNCELHPPTHLIRVSSRYLLNVYKLNNNVLHSKILIILNIRSNLDPSLQSENYSA